MASDKEKLFSAEERAAMRERARELKAEGRKADGEKDLLAKIDEMQGADKAIAAKLHSLIKEIAPGIESKTWYGMPAWARDGSVVCFFQSAGKFKTRYATFGFTDKANLDAGSIWPTYFGITQLTEAEEGEVREILKKAFG